MLPKTKTWRQWCRLSSFEAKQQQQSSIVISWFNCENESDGSFKYKLLFYLNILALAISVFGLLYNFYSGTWVLRSPDFFFR